MEFNKELRMEIMDGMLSYNNVPSLMETYNIEKEAAIIMVQTSRKLVGLPIDED
ncbi:hypothetical protein bcgnr5369_26550 [Bacillus cereus]|uniref:hypothetical protein n=1 Tax=Bacillus cereus TaxID=1396 RepID=UPI001483383F|nr:hypothetical protein [Bacillus cereus]